MPSPCQTHPNHPRRQPAQGCGPVTRLLYSPQRHVADTKSSPSQHMSFPDQPGWYCLKTHPKRERTAAQSLRTLPGLEVLAPLVRYRRSGASRPSLEPLFPNYLFARFTPLHAYKAVSYASGVAYIVRQGSTLVPVHEGVIRELNALAPTQILDLSAAPLHAGDKVRVINGIFKGSTAEVASLRPATERVSVLLELLGRPSRIELSLDEVERRYRHPLCHASNEGL